LIPGDSRLTGAVPPLRSLDEVARLLIAPDAGERLSPIGGGDGVLIVDLASSTAEQAQLHRLTLEAALPVLPCVTVAVAPAEQAAEFALIEQVCDVVLPDASALPGFLAGFAHTKIAGLAFAQLLRGAPRRTIHEGLLAESFVYSTLQSGAEFSNWRDARRRRKGSGRTEDGAAVRLDRDRGVLEIYLTRPAKHNAFSRAMRDGLCEALQLAITDLSIESVILRGEGDSFCSGGDLDEFGSFPDPAEAHVIRTTRSPALLLSQLSERVQVEVQGACMGAGAELPAFTGQVVAEEDAFFQLPEVGLGLVPGAGGTVSLPLRIGRQRTAWLGLSGARIDARIALDWGLVDEVRLGHRVAPDAD
jgi:enoyl-CoA hydratase